MIPLYCQKCSLTTHLQTPETKILDDDGDDDDDDDVEDDADDDDDDDDDDDAADDDYDDDADDYDDDGDDDHDRDGDNETNQNPPPQLVQTRGTIRKLPLFEPVRKPEGQIPSKCSHSVTCEEKARKYL